MKRDNPILALGTIVMLILASIALAQQTLDRTQKFHRGTKSCLGVFQRGQRHSLVMEQHLCLSVTICR